jgi:hypothetical protein
VTWLGLVPAETVLKISNPVAGLVTGLAEFNAVKAMRGGKKPLFVDETSSFAEASGVVVPMPVWAINCIENNHPAMNKKYLIIYTIESMTKLSNT